jgi:hypothetical protein
MALNPFRRSASADTAKKPGRGRKGTTYERWSLPKINATPFLMMNTEYVDLNPSPDEIIVDPQTGRPMEVKKPYAKRRVHKRVLTLAGGKKRILESTCSAGFNPHNPQPCAGCGAIDQGARDINTADVAVFGVIHLATYHKHPIIDRKTGGIVMRQPRNPGEQATPMLIDDECVGRTCNFCRAASGQPIVQDPQNPWPGYNPSDIQTFFGKRRYMELGKNHLTALMGWDAQIASMCGNDNSPIITDGFACPHCNALVIDLNNDPRTDDQINAAVVKPYPCMNCNRPVLLKELVSCEVCEQHNRQPVQHSIADRVLWGVKQGEGTSTQIMLHRHESLQEFAARVPAQLLGGKTLDQVLADLNKPYDFAQLFQPKGLADQAAELELQGTQGAVPQNAMPGYAGPAQQSQYRPAPLPMQPPIAAAAPGPQVAPPMVPPHFGRNG